MSKIKYNKPMNFIQMMDILSKSDDTTLLTCCGKRIREGNLYTWFNDLLVPIRFDEKKMILDLPVYDIHLVDIYNKKWYFIDYEKLGWWFRR